MKIKMLKDVLYPCDNEFIKGNVIFDEKIRTFIYGDNIDIKVDEIIDCEGLMILPGMIDPHVHFNTPGFENHETFEKGTRGAIKGGVTTIIDMPCTSLPPVVSKEAFYNKYDVVKDQAFCDYAFHGGISGNLFEEKNFSPYIRIGELVDCGVTALKIYTVSGMDTFKSVDNYQMFEIMKSAALKDITVMVHAEDQAIVDSLQKKFMSENKIQPKDYAAARPVEAELIAINNIAYMASLTGARVHIVHISSAEGVELVEEWRQYGVDISCETCPHYLEFNEEDLQEKGGMLKTAPVVKTKEDSEFLWLYLKTGLISFISTDHAPCDFEKEKNTGSIWSDYGGIPGVEIIYPYIISEGLLKDKIDLNTMLKITSENAARLYGIFPQKGSVNPGADADFILIDPDEENTIKSELFESMGKYSPFNNWNLKGKIKQVYLRGEKVVEDDEIINKIGTLIKRK